ncbi:MAG: S26 family signal peptidase [Thermoplasmatales archaeon]
MASGRNKEVIALIGVALALLIIFSSLYLYTENWPPAVIVESKSMQHGNNFVFGVINTGDIVAVKRASSFWDVITYLVAREDGGPVTYGEYGEVIVYRNYLLNELVIHRAMFYVSGWSGDSPIIYGDKDPSWISIRGPLVYIEDVGFSHRDLVVDLQSYIGQTGFVTMGDYNFAFSEYKSGNYYVGADQNLGIDNSLVNQSQVFGYAVGYLPIVGVIKLWDLKLIGKITYIPETTNIVMIIILSLLVIFIVLPVSTGNKNRKMKEN